MKTINELTNKLIPEIKQYALSQKEQWQQIPYLALEADGRTGYNDHYSITYQKGLWHLSDDFTVWDIFVDLATGNIVSTDLDFNIKNTNPFIDSQILSIAQEIGSINASSIIERLEKEASEPYLSCYDSKKQEKWREETRQKYGIEKIYTRRGGKW